MKFSSDAKIFSGIILATVIIVIGGAIALSKQQSQLSVSEDKVYSESELVAPDSWSLGKKDARVWIVEFSDFQCPACANAHSMIKQVLEQYGEKIRFIYRNYPLPSHKLSKKAALAAEAAGEQGKYWEYHDKLFENQSVWSNESDPTKTFILYAKEIGLDLNKFSNSLENKKFQGRIETDVAVGNTVNIIQTPTFFINGMRLSDWTSFDQFKTEIEKRM